MSQGVVFFPRWQPLLCHTSHKDHSFAAGQWLNKENHGQSVTKELMSTLGDHGGWSRVSDSFRDASCDKMSGLPFTVPLLASCSCGILQTATVVITH